jgi:hypothetical protein
MASAYGRLKNQWIVEESGGRRKKKGKKKMRGEEARRGVPFQVRNTEHRHVATLLLGIEHRPQIDVRPRLGGVELLQAFHGNLLVLLHSRSSYFFKKKSEKILAPGLSPAQFLSRH